MATISESCLSRQFTVGYSKGDRELVYDIAGTEDESAVEDLIIATAPSSYGGLSLDSIQAEPQGGGLWKGYARYTLVSGSDEYTFDTGGGTQRITQSLGTISSYAPPGFTPPDFGGAIGVSDDRVEGTEVPAPKFDWTETHYLTDATVTPSYKLALVNLTGRMNDASFKGLASGECLFLGATGSKRGNENWAITYRFSASPNVSGASIGDITGIDKLGWDYLWVRYADFEDASAYALVKRPVAVYVERVCYMGDFSTLGIGV